MPLGAAWAMACAFAAVCGAARASPFTAGAAAHNADDTAYGAYGAARAGGEGRASRPLASRGAAKIALRVYGY